MELPTTWEDIKSKVATAMIEDISSAPEEYTYANKVIPKFLRSVNVLYENHIPNGASMSIDGP